jgi:hypothetical protein
VVKENDFAPQFGLEPARGVNFGDEKPLWKKTARLLTKANQRLHFEPSLAAEN